jgi:hypothetical protein
MSDIVIVKIIDEVREITAEQVAKKQDAARLNFTKIIEKIKTQASIGNSSCVLPEHEINEYDKKLLTQEGFVVRLIDEPIGKYDYQRGISRDCTGVIKKIWQITW